MPTDPFRTMIQIKWHATAAVPIKIRRRPSLIGSRSCTPRLKPGVPQCEDAQLPIKAETQIVSAARPEGWPL